MIDIGAQLVALQQGKTELVINQATIQKIIGDEFLQQEPKVLAAPASREEEPTQGSLPKKLDSGAGVKGSTLPQTQTATNGTQSAGCKHCARVGQASFIKYVDRAVQTDSNSDDDNRRSKNASCNTSPGLAKGQPACQSSQMVGTHQEVTKEKRRQEPKDFGHRNLKRIRHAKADDRWKEIQAPKKEVTISLAWFNNCRVIPTYWTFRHNVELLAL